MKVAIVGSRDYPRLSDVRAYVRGLGPDTVVISGGARGVDAAAVSEARRRGLGVEVFPADWETHKKAAGMIRNKAIIQAADEVVAFWDGRSAGTAHAIRLARQAGKPLRVVSAVGSPPVSLG